MSRWPVALLHADVTSHRYPTSIEDDTENPRSVEKKGERKRLIPKFFVLRRNAAPVAVWIFACAGLLCLI